MPQDSGRAVTGHPGPNVPSTYPIGMEGAEVGLLASHVRYPRVSHAPLERGHHRRGVVGRHDLRPSGERGCDEAGACRHLEHSPEAASGLEGHATIRGLGPSGLPTTCPEEPSFYRPPVEAAELADSQQDRTASRVKARCEVLDTGRPSVVSAPNATTAP